MTSSDRNTAHLQFDGPPFVDETGMDPSFISKATPAFTNLVTSLAQDPGDQGESADARPMLLARTNLNSSTFRIREDDRDTPEAMVRFQELIESLDEDNLEGTEEAIGELTDQAFNDLKKFLNVNAAAETAFRVDYRDTATGMDQEMIKTVLKMLRGMKKSEVKEEGVRVNFTGYLPMQKKAEFTRNGENGVITAKVHPKAHGLEDIIKRIEEERTISLVTRQADGGNANTTILAVTT